MLRNAFEAFSIFMLAYFVILNANYTLLFFLGRKEVWRYVERAKLRNYKAISHSPLSPAVSILMPAYNEGPVISDSVKGILELNYANFEVVVINDGSKDETMDELKRDFALVPVERVPLGNIKTKHVRGIYVSSTNPKLIVIDKDNGGKSDALNAGLLYSHSPLFCAVDGDTLLEGDALPRLVRQFQIKSSTIAVGGIVRVSNGCTIEGATIKEVRAPRKFILNLQIVEYLRAFLVGRTGWSSLGMLLIISGAFGMFRRQLVIDAGGYCTETVGEDAELVVRLHRHCRENGLPHDVSFLADPVCWTQAPDDWGTLGRQRDRWQRGLLEVLWRHRKMIGNPRYGKIGMVAMPYFVVFEALGPLIELTGYVVFFLGLVFGYTPGAFAAVLFFLAFGYGLTFSLGALYLEERSFQRYRSGSDIVRLLLCAIIDNIGYRQWQTLIRGRAYLTVLRKEAKWGEMVRVSHNAHALKTEEPTTKS